MQRGRAVAGVALIGLAVVIFAGWSPWSWALPWSGSADSQHSELGPGVRTVVLDTGSGDVTIGAGARTGVTTRVDAWAWIRPDPAYRRDGDTLVLTGCGYGCSVDYELVVPRGVAVEGETGSGDVTVAGVATVDVELGSGNVAVRAVGGAVAVDTGSGEISVHDVVGPVAVDTGSGGIQLSGVSRSSRLHSSSGSVSGEMLHGPVDASTNSGDVVLNLDGPQDVRAETSSGDVELTVPAGRYRVEHNGDHHDIGVIDDPSARHSLDLTTSSGDITVDPR